jgi:hypothetical protein
MDGPLSLLLQRTINKGPRKDERLDCQREERSEGGDGCWTVGTRWEGNVRLRVMVLRKRRKR